MSRKRELDESPIKGDGGTPYEPAELIRLQRALTALRIASGPSTTVRIDPFGRRREVDPPIPDSARIKHRNYLRRVLRQLDKISTEVTIAVYRNDFKPARCASCKAELEVGALVCESCGRRTDRGNDRDRVRHHA